MVRVSLVLPRSLRTYWPDAVERADLSGETLEDALRELAERFPGLGARVLDDQGRVRRHIGLFVNARSVAHLAPRDVALAEGDVVRVLPAVSGGGF